MPQQPVAQAPAGVRETVLDWLHRHRSHGAIADVPTDHPELRQLVCECGASLVITTTKAVAA